MTLALRQETWGDRLHRAYRQARAEYRLTYDRVAQTVSQVKPMSDQSIMRLEELEEEPTDMDRRQRAYFTLLALGFDPADWNLTPENCQLGAYDMRKVRALLSPRAKRGGGGSSVRNRCSSSSSYSAIAAA